MSIREHYENHLASYYTWMVGDFEATLAENYGFFRDNGILPFKNRIALDLGAGNGLQSIPLAQLGFEVTAVDLSPTLLTELKNRSRGLNIKAIEENLLNFELYKGLEPELIVCMGDTLTHLDSIQAVEHLIQGSYDTLADNGHFIVSFRDLTMPPADEQRFIPVRSDSTRILTCFIENHKDRIKVFDIVNELENENWTQKISSYYKIKVGTAQVEHLMQQAGFEVGLVNINRGMITMIGRKN